MSTTRVFRFFLLLLSFSLFHTVIYADRAEMTGDFVSSDYTRNKSAVSPLPKLNARSDIPELFDRKYSFSDDVRSDSTLQEINGFRVQIFRTEDINEAKRRESIYIDTFGEENIVLIFEKPFYRIRAGRFRNKEEAEEFQNSIIQRGILNSIIIPDRVKVLMPAEKKK